MEPLRKYTIDIQKSISPLVFSVVLVGMMHIGSMGMLMYNCSCV